MVINLTTTSITVSPFVVIPAGTDVYVSIQHKETKTTATSLETPTNVGSKVSVALPDMTSISNVATNGDELLVTLTYPTQIVFVSMGYWITSNYDMFHEWKSWTTTASQSTNWITL